MVPQAPQPKKPTRAVAAGAQRSVARADMPARTPDVRCTCFMVRSLSRKISQLYDDALAPSGLKGTQFSLLAQARSPRAKAPLTVSALAGLLHTDRTTLTRNLRTLEQGGLITLEAGADARSRCVLVTPEGEAAYRHALGLWKQAQTQVRELGGSAQIAALEQLVTQLLPRMAQAQEVAA